MFETLIVNEASINFCFHFLSSQSIIHFCITQRCETKLLKKWLYVSSHIESIESRSIHCCRLISSNCSTKYLKQMSHCHTRNDTMRIEENIWHYSILSKRHICSTNEKRTYSFLCSTRISTDAHFIISFHNNESTLYLTTIYFANIRFDSCLIVFDWHSYIISEIYFQVQTIYVLIRESTIACVDC